MIKVGTIFLSVLIAFLISIAIIFAIMILSVISDPTGIAGVFGILGWIFLGPVLIILLTVILSPIVYRKLVNGNKGIFKRILIYILLGLAILVFLLRHEFLKTS